MAITIDIMKQSVQENKLNLSRKKLKDSDIEVICSFLSDNPQINSLDVSWNQIGDEGANALAANTSLISLNVGCNQIGVEGAKALAAIRLEIGDGIYGQIKTQEQKQNLVNTPSRAEDTSSTPTWNISMMVLGGFIAAAGIAAVAIACTLLNAASFGIAGLVLAGLGVAAALTGVGLFASGAYKKSHHTGANESLFSNDTQQQSIFSVELSEPLERLIQVYPIDQWWRLFIDGHRQYSLINREPTQLEMSMPGFKETLKPACEAFDVFSRGGFEKGYMEASLYAFFSLLDKVNAPLTLDMIKDTHAKATTGLTAYTDHDTLDKQFKPGTLRNESTLGGFYLKPKPEKIQYAWTITMTEAGIEELINQESMLGIKYFSGPDKKRPKTIFTDNISPLVHPLPCKLDALEAKINEIIIAYENNITKKSDTINKIRVIADTIQKLERLHPFEDGNCRTFCMQILNKELLRHNMYPAILFDPNTFDAFSLDEMVQEIIAGQIRFKEILKFATCNDERLKKEATITFKSTVYPDLKHYHHENIPPPIRLNQAEKASSMLFVERALLKVPDNALISRAKVQLTESHSEENDTKPSI